MQKFAYTMQANTSYSLLKCGKLISNTFLLQGTKNNNILYCWLLQQGLVKVISMKVWFAANYC